MRLMLQRALIPALALTIGIVGSSVAAPARPVILKWPPWISIEAPVNPADPSVRGASFLIHALTHDGRVSARDVSATAEGLVNGSRKSIQLRIDTTSRPGVFAVRRQWPADGKWLVRVGFLSTTALVAIGNDGTPAGAVVPTEKSPNAPMPIPRAVTARDIDAMLASATK